jgi:NAD-dependent SIR2 family protein deacetylase
MAAQRDKLHTDVHIDGGAPMVKRTPSGHSYDENTPDLAPLAEEMAALFTPLDDEDAADEEVGEEPASPSLNAHALNSAAKEHSFGEQINAPTVTGDCSSGGSSTSSDAARAAFTAKAAATFSQRGGYLRHTDQLFKHGALYEGPMKQPKVLWRSDQKPRKDHDADDWLTATEFEDVAEVMKAKVEQMAALMRVSRRTVLYTGAGISASAVGQAALSGVNKTGWLAKAEAQPTPTHHALAVLGRTGWVHGWVQQNHDGLPQKAGFPQEKVCEVHGSWFDPSNPVVKYSGSLKDQEAEWMERETEDADLVLVLGTSLGGLFADQVATRCARRACVGASLGSCIINLQQTMEDGKMAVNVFGKSDDVLRMLLEELGLPPLSRTPPVWPEVRTHTSCAM